jgi:adenosyl cobinamide kinase/adenosyl cobinamide phosphate guanylyltransferase
VAAHPDFEVDVPPVVDALVRRAGDTIVVSDEVGLGVHPSTEIGQRFRDVLGLVNHAVAEVCDQVLLVVAGRVLPLERW